MMKVGRIFIGYLRRFLRLWLFWFWFAALDAIGLIVDTFLPGFSPPRWIYWAIAGTGFIVANVKLFSDQENRIAELSTSKVDALKAVVQEIQMNRDIATRNAQIRGNASSPGSLPFERLDISQCQGTLLSGQLALNDALPRVAQEYLQLVKRVNTLIASVEASTARFQSAGGNANTIRKLCGEQSETNRNDQVASLPNLMDRLERLIEREIANAQPDQV